MADGVPAITGQLQTLQREPIRKLRLQLDRFRDRFEPHLTNQGEVAMVRGPHGSGKTHTIFAVWEQLRARKDLFLIYVLQQNADLLDLYAQVAQRLDLTLLKRLSGSLLGAITAEQAGVETGDQDTRIQLSPVLQAQPEKAKLLLDSYKVQAGATKVRQEQALLDLTQGSKDLTHVLQCLQGDQFDTQAAAWLCGEPVDPMLLQAMGVSGPLARPEQVSSALELLIALFALAAQPMVLIVDQCERLLVDDPSLALANAGHLRSWVEAFVTRNGMLVLSGNTDAWELLPDDVKQRVGLNVIDCPLLDLEEAIDIVRIYVTPPKDLYTPGMGSIRPFAEDAVRTMLSAGGGNPRKFLQLCYLAYQEKEYQTKSGGSFVIGESLVRKLIRDDMTGQFVDRDRVVQETRRLLARGTGQLLEKFSVAGMVFDFALLNAGGNPALLVDLKEAIFAHDEAANALLSARTVLRLREGGVKALYALVVSGYVSPEIVDQLNQVVDELVVFSSGRYEDDLRRLLEIVRGHPADAPPLPPVNVEEINQLLKQIVDQRAQANVVVHTRGEESAEHFERKRYEERRDAARRDWSLVRRELEQRILQVRRESMQKDLLDVAVDVRRANRARLVRLVAAVSIWLAAVLIYPLVRYSSYPPAWERSYLLLVAASFRSSFLLFALTTLGSMFIVFDWLAAISKQDLLRVPGSFQEIERIASTYVLPFVWADPLARLARRCRLLKRRVSALARFLPSEPLSIFRQLFCREALASHDADELFSELRKLSKTAFKAEWAILLDSALAHKFQKDDQASKSLGSPFDLVCALQTGNMTGKHHRLSLALCALTIRDDQKMGSPWDHLRIAVEEGLDRATLSGLQFLSERDLREAIREFTPFEEGGLGTFYQLRSIRQIDELFLLSSQMLLYFERDLLREP